MRWAEQQRINWIAKQRLPFNRADLMEKFGIGRAQASKDINKFMDLNPGLLTYNRHKKHFEPEKTND